MKILFAVLSFLLLASEARPLDLGTADLRVSLYGVYKMDVISESGKNGVSSLVFSNSHVRVLTNKGPKKETNITVITNIFCENTNFVLSGLAPGWYEVTVTDIGVSNIVAETLFPQFREKGWMSDSAVLSGCLSNGGIRVNRGHTYYYRLYPGIESTFVFRNMDRFEWFIHGDWAFYGVKSRFVTNDAMGAVQEKKASGLYRCLWDYVSSADKNTKIAALISNYSALGKTPVIQDDSTLFFFTNKIAGGLGSMYWGPGTEYFDSVKGSGIYFKSLRLKPDAFLEYKFALETAGGNSWFEDDKNPYIKNINDLGKGNSFVIYPPVFDRFTNLFSPETYTRGMTVKKGERVTNISFTNKALGGEKVIHVYLPPSYFTSTNRSYPVIYATDGQMYDALDMQFSLDAVAKRTGKEFIFVMVDTKNRGPEMYPYDIDFARTNTQDYTNFMKKTSREWRQTPLEVRKFLSVALEHDNYLAGTVVPFVDSSFRTLKDRARRAYMGQSWGGQKAFDTAFKFPETFGVIIAQSPVTRNFDIIGKVMKKLDTVLFCSYGAYDLEGINTPQCVSLMNDTARRYFKKYKIEEFSGGHNPYAWMLELDRIVSFVF